MHMKITTNNVNWPTVKSILPNPKVDSWAMTAIKIVGLVISLPIALLMDLVKLAAAKFQEKKEEELEAPRPTWKDKASDLTNNVVSTVKSTPGNVYNFVVNNKAKVILGLGAVSAFGAGIYYRTFITSFINSLFYKAEIPVPAATRIIPQEPGSAHDAILALAKPTKLESAAVNLPTEEPVAQVTPIQTVEPRPA